MWSPIHKQANRLYQNTRTYYRKQQLKRKAKNLIQQGLLPYPLTTPIDDELRNVNDLVIGHTSIQGYRVQMEDSHIIEATEIAGHTLLGILDGHAGDTVAKIASAEFLNVLHNDSNWKAYKASVPSRSSEKIASEQDIELLSKALVHGFLAMDEHLYELGLASGSTAVLAIVTPSHVVCASVGDSRCVIGQHEGGCISLTEDHKPDVADEHRRIVDAGGFVAYQRVMGQLAMSRALGDFQYKMRDDLPVTNQMVIAVPDIGVHQRTLHDKFILLACDGLWDVITNEESTGFTHELLTSMGIYGNEECGLSSMPVASAAGQANVLTAAKVLVDVALSAGSMDNISVLLATLPAPANAPVSLKRSEVTDSKPSAKKMRR